MQSMAAWTLANIASGLSEHTRTLIEHGAVPLLVQLLSSGSEEIKEQVKSSPISRKTIVYMDVLLADNFVVSCIEQAMWALSNIAGDSPSARDDVFDHGALSPLLSILWSPTCIAKNSAWKIANWAFSNFCVRKPLPKLLEKVGKNLRKIFHFCSKFSISYINFLHC